MKTGMMRKFTDAVDKCRQAAFDVRNEIGESAYRAFIDFDAALSTATERFVNATMEVTKWR